MLVGGVNFVKESGRLRRGEEMGNFELAGSTIILMLSQDVRRKLLFIERFSSAFGGKTEIPLSMGEKIASITL